MGCDGLSPSAREGDLRATLAARTLTLENTGDVPLYYYVSFEPPPSNALTFALCTDPVRCPNVPAEATVVLERPPTRAGIAPGEPGYPREAAVGFYRLVPGPSAGAFQVDSLRSLQVRR